MSGPGAKGNIGLLCASLLRAGDVAVDVGAGDGTEAIAMAEVVGLKGRVVMVDPDTRHAAVLKGVAKQYPQTLFVLGAMGARDGVMILHRGEKAEHSSLCLDAVAKRTGRQDALVMSLDGPLFKDASLVKLDTQGWECAVLDGAQRLLRACPAWVVECWPWGLKQAGRSVDDLLGQLRDAGLKIYWSDRQEMTPKDFANWVKGCSSHSFTNLVALR